MVARAAPHFWEEPCISGVRGSGAIFFSGCALRCVYCQNHEISAGGYGREVSVKQLRDIMDNLVSQGVHNINLVTPQHYTESILEALEEPLPVPVVWNSSGYELPETIEGLRGKVQIFMPDWKYAQQEPAALYSGAPDYPAVVLDAVKAMIGVAGLPRFDGKGMMTGGVLVRHLVLPGHMDNTRAVIDGFAKHFRGRALFSLLGQYTPMAAARDYPHISRGLTRREYLRAVDYLFNCGIEDGFTQEKGSDTASFIPSFDLTGVPGLPEEG